MTRWWARLKGVVINKILGVADTPHRIAWGVFLGFIIGWTPTLGFQIVLYVTTASLLRANKVSGIPIVFISNPFSAVPLYYFAWWVGNLALHGGGDMSADTQLLLDSLGMQTDQSLWDGLVSAEFWTSVGRALVALGAELWLGCFIMGVITGVPGYLLTHWGVRSYRRRKAR